MQIQYLRPLSESWQHTKRMLFQPFDLGKWLVIGFTAWLAGLFRGGGGEVNRSIKGPADVHLAAQEMARGVSRAVHRLLESPFTGTLIVLAVVALILIVLALLWVSSRAKFMFLDNVANDRAAVVEPWKRLRRLGDSLFLWRLCFGVASLVLVLLIVGGTVASLVLVAAGKSLDPGSLLVVVLAAMIILALSVVILFVVIWVENFVVPIMYRFNLGVLAAWSHFWRWLRVYPAAFIVYGLFVILLAICFGLTVVLFGLMTCCIGLILIALPYVGTVLLLPVWVTYRSLGPRFLEQLSPEFGIFPAPMAEAAAAVEEAPTEE
jgi:hypothetical protein